jgi:hypothetical protein
MVGLFEANSLAVLVMSAVKPQFATEGLLIMLMLPQDIGVLGVTVVLPHTMLVMVTGLSLPILPNC